MANYTFSATGGSGAGYHAKIIVTETGDYNLVVGSGGIGYGTGKGGSPTGTNGETSTIKKGTTTLISAGGGTGGRSGPVWATAGSGGTLTKDSSLIEDEVYTSTNGNNGGAYAGGAGVSVSGAAGPISGHTWGSSGNSAGSFVGGWADPSYHGYIMIKYIAPLPDMVTFTINPTPADAVVKITYGGTVHTGNTISVYKGTTVSWEVSKDGYQSKTGTTTPTSNTTQNVTIYSWLSVWAFIFDSSPDYTGYYYLIGDYSTSGLLAKGYTSNLCNITSINGTLGASGSSLGIIDSFGRTGTCSYSATVTVNNIKVYKYVLSSTTYLVLEDSVVGSLVFVQDSYSTLVVNENNIVLNGQTYSKDTSYEKLWTPEGLI